LAIDLGSSNTIIYLQEKGIVVDEPTMLARKKKKKWTGLSAPKFAIAKPIAYGYKAKEMLNREPGQIEVVVPIKNGNIADLEGLEFFINYFLKLVYEIPNNKLRFIKSKLLVSIPSSMNQVNRRALRELFKQIGSFNIFLIEQPVLAAIGLGLSMESGSGLVVVDVGGGKTEISVVSMGGIVIGKTIPIAGGTMDADIVNYIRMKYGILIGSVSAERLKINNGGIVRGRNLETGLPKSVKLREEEILEAVGLTLSKISSSVIRVIDETPPELMDDILKRGIVLVGGGSKIKGLNKLIEGNTHINCRVADEPNLCVIKGCGELLEKNRDLDNFV